MTSMSAKQNQADDVDEADDLDFDDEALTDAVDAEMDEVDRPTPPRAEGQGVAAMRAEIENLGAEKAALFEKLARTQADYQNSRRRLENDATQHLTLAVGRLIRSLLPVVDNLERALALDPEKTDVKAVLNGVNGTYQQFLDVLKSQGVEAISPEPGTPFDPNRHEALMQEAGDYDEPTVTRLLQKGYTFGGKPVRAAQVAVSK